MIELVHISVQSILHLFHPLGSVGAEGDFSSVTKKLKILVNRETRKTNKPHRAI